MRRVCAAVAIAMGAVFSPGQARETEHLPVLDAAGLVSDARLLESVYGQLHPGLYR
jgi:hypothetical protein